MSQRIVPNGGSDRQPSPANPAAFLTLSALDADAIMAHLDELGERLDKLAEQREVTSQRRLHNREQTAEILGCSVPQVDALRRAKKLQATYFDGTPRFTNEDIEAFISAHRGAEPVRKQHPRTES